MVSTTVVNSTFQTSICPCVLRSPNTGIARQISSSAQMESALTPHWLVTARTIVEMNRMKLDVV